ncbi:hypothetical protein ACJDU8_21630 [Clostridium sp. WILCCON 0269]|uniref:Flagellar protein n=1 Tax=Candidatus Clostridium eludens TaxID=3381663 RepID=A0ABW8SSG3_9CLOT
MKCFKCDKITGEYEKDKDICAKCREVLKIDIVREVLQLDPVYLSENNRHKSGRPRKLTATEESDIYYAYKRKEMSMGELAKNIR